MRGKNQVVFVLLINCAFLKKRKKNVFVQLILGCRHIVLGDPVSVRHVTG